MLKAGRFELKPEKWKNVNLVRNHGMRMMLWTGLSIERVISNHLTFFGEKTPSFSSKAAQIFSNRAFNCSQKTEREKRIIMTTKEEQKSPHKED